MAQHSRRRPGVRVVSKVGRRIGRGRALHFQLHLEELPRTSHGLVSRRGPRLADCWAYRLRFCKESPGYPSSKVSVVGSVSGVAADGSIQGISPVSFWCEKYAIGRTSDHGKAFISACLICDKARVEGLLLVHASVRRETPISPVGPTGVRISLWQ